MEVVKLQGDKKQKKETYRPSPTIRLTVKNITTKVYHIVKKGAN